MQKAAFHFNQRTAARYVERSYHPVAISATLACTILCSLSSSNLGRRCHPPISGVTRDVEDESLTASCYFATFSSSYVSPAYNIETSMKTACLVRRMPLLTATMRQSSSLRTCCPFSFRVSKLQQDAVHAACDMHQALRDAEHHCYTVHATYLSSPSHMSCSGTASLQCCRSHYA